MRPNFLKVTDTPVFKIIIECGTEKFNPLPTSERMIFMQKDDVNDSSLHLRLSAIFDKKTKLLTPKT